MAEGDRYLIPNLIPGGVDQKRGHHVSKAYGRFRRNVGVSGETQKLHALRNTFVAMMEGNEVPESTVAHIVGHKHPTMTFGHYSNGERVKLRDAINKLDYGPEVMSAIEALPPRRSGNEMG
jgi:integrase